MTRRFSQAGQRSSTGHLSGPGLVWAGGNTPTSTRFGDIYFSPEDGLAETRHVFLDGTGLLDLWHERPRGGFVVGETGFGTGLNFLAVWDLWRRHGPKHGWLHFISVEGFPMGARDLERAHHPFPELRPLSKALLSRYGTPLPGFHRLHFDEDRIHLTLLHGDAAGMLEALDAGVDAWFLDGFSPARNPDMWSERVIRAVGRLSRPGARLATFTAAGLVRRRLAESGFEVERKPGFGRKRDMTVARFKGPAPGGGAGHAPWFARRPKAATAAAQAYKTVIIAGAGIAGAGIAAALARRGITPRIWDPSGVPASGASGNPAGILMPRLTADATPAGRFHTAAFSYVCRHLDPSACLGGKPLNGVLQLSTTGAEWQRHQRLVMRSVLPVDLMRFVGREEAGDLAGLDVTGPGLFFPSAGAVDPATLVRSLLKNQEIEPGSLDLEAGDLGAGDLGVGDLGAGDLPGGADAVILANGLGAAAFPGGDCLDLRGSMGQLAACRWHGTAPLKRVVTFGGYALPLDCSALGGDTSGHGILTGASYRPVSGPSDRLETDPSDEVSATLLAAAGEVIPALKTASRPFWARTAVRATTPDHMPLAGPMPDRRAFTNAFEGLRSGLQPLHTHDTHHTELPGHHNGLFACTGLGSRGLVTGPLLGELLVSSLFGDPLPIECDLADSVHTARFLVRAMRRRIA